MNVQEVFEFYKRSKLCRDMPLEKCDSHKRCVECEAFHDVHLNHHEAESIILDALEKQIPKKPIDIHHYGGGTSHIGGHCECGFFVSKEMHNWCPKCGNKLDWSDGDE